MLVDNSVCVCFLFAALALIGGLCNCVWAMDWIGGPICRFFFGKTGARVVYVVAGVLSLAMIALTLPNFARWAK